MIAAKRVISITEVQEVVARAFHLSRTELLSRSRRQHVAYARHVAMYLSRELVGKAVEAGANAMERRTSVSFPRIGKAFCRDHSSVIHACNVIGRRLHQDTVFAQLLRKLAHEVRDRAGSGAWGVCDAITSATTDGGVRGERPCQAGAAGEQAWASAD